MSNPAEVAKYLRRITPAEYTFEITSLSISGERPVQFTTQLGAESRGRTGFFAYNNSHYNSGECYWGPAGVTSATGMPIPKGVVMEIPLVEDIDVWFTADVDTMGDLRILELS
jgi:hypothetical protein